MRFGIPLKIIMTILLLLIPGKLLLYRFILAARCIVCRNTIYSFRIVTSRQVCSLKGRCISLPKRITTGCIHSAWLRFLRSILHHWQLSLWCFLYYVQATLLGQIMISIACHRGHALIQWLIRLTGNSVIKIRCWGLLNNWFRRLPGRSTWWWRFNRLSCWSSSRCSSWFGPGVVAFLSFLVCSLLSCEFFSSSYPRPSILFHSKCNLDDRIILHFIFNFLEILEIQLHFLPISIS